MPAPKRRTTRSRSAQPKRILNCRPSEKTEQDFTFEHAARAIAGAKRAGTNDGSVPDDSPSPTFR